MNKEEAQGLLWMARTRLEVAHKDLSDAMDIFVNATHAGITAGILKSDALCKARAEAFQRAGSEYARASSAFLDALCGVEEDDGGDQRERTYTPRPDAPER